MTKNNQMTENNQMIENNQMTENITLVIKEINGELEDIPNNKSVEDELAEMFNLDKKKKKSKEKKDKDKNKTKNIDELTISYNSLESPPSYNYHELLSNLYKQIGNLETKEKHKFMICQPIVIKITIKKVLWSNFNEICTGINRSPEDLFLYTMNELNTEGSFNENKQLIIKGKFHSKNIENILRKYMCCYVQCNLCRSNDTMITKDITTRLQYLVCNSCKGSKTIPIIKRINI